MDLLGGNREGKPVQALQEEQNQGRVAGRQLWMWRVRLQKLDVPFSRRSGCKDVSVLIANTQQMLFRLPLALALAALSQTLRGLLDSRQGKWVELFLCAAYYEVHNKPVFSYSPHSSLWSEESGIQQG